MDLLKKQPRQMPGESSRQSSTSSSRLTLPLRGLMEVLRRKKKATRMSTLQLPHFPKHRRS